MKAVLKSQALISELDFRATLFFEHLTFTTLVSFAILWPFNRFLFSLLYPSAGPLRGIKYSIAATAILFILLFVAVLLLAKYISFLAGGSRDTIRLILRTFLLLVVTTACFQLASRGGVIRNTAAEVDVWVRAVLFGVAVLMTVFLAHLAVAIGYSVWIIRRWLVKEAWANLIDDHYQVLKSLASVREERFRFREHNRVVRILELSAVRFERTIPRLLRPGDPRTERQVREELTQIASAYRESKKLVLLGGRAACEELTTTMSQNLELIASGEWRALPKLKCDDVPKPDVRHVLLSSARTLVIALFPLVVLVFVDRGIPTLSAAFMEKGVAAASFWAVVTILTVLDPGWNKKLAAVKDTLDSAARFKSSDGEK